MSWAESIVSVLKKYNVRFLNYVPDAKIETILAAARQLGGFEALPLTREEEGIGIVCGQSLGGGRGVMLCPTAGLGNSINAVAALAIAYRIPCPIIIGVRGDLGEFNPAQVAMGQATQDILDALRIPTYRITREDETEKMTEGALRICYASEGPVAILVTNELAGWKEGKTKTP
jgi:sulfopyruvate decarboxylase alpha subunit